jgi:hypothetical protein
MHKTFEIYETICSICAAIEGFAECSIYKGENSVTKDLGIPNFISTCRTYDGYLEDLYDLAVDEQVLDELLDLMSPQECLPFREVCEEREEDIRAKAHEDLIYSVKEGDKVRLYNGGVFYVVSIDGKSIWISKRPGGPEGWSADLDDIEEIIESAEE